MCLDCISLGRDTAHRKRNVDKALQERGKQHPGAMWYHVAEYIEKLQAGYLRFDLNQMGQDDSEEPKEPEQWIQ